MAAAAGVFGKHALPAETIDHTGPRPAVTEAGMNARYGEYLARLGCCRDCHWEDFSGGKSPEPGSPPAPDLELEAIYLYLHSLPARPAAN